LKEVPNEFGHNKMPKAYFVNWNSNEHIPVKVISKKEVNQTKFILDLQFPHLTNAAPGYLYLVFPEEEFEYHCRLSTILVVTSNQGQQTKNGVQKALWCRYKQVEIQHVGSAYSCRMDFQLQ
jgi:hypothetical protein